MINYKCIVIEGKRENLDITSNSWNEILHSNKETWRQNKKFYNIEGFEAYKRTSGRDCWELMNSWRLVKISIRCLRVS